MPTINFKNATGTFTYEEAAAPPEQTTGPTGGLITALQCKPNFDVVIDGQTYEADIAANNYAIAKLDDYTIRYEIRRGDKCDYIGDPTSVNRANLARNKHHQTDSVIKAAFRIWIEQGTPNGAEWFTIGEQHNSDDDLPNNQHTSPIFAVELLGEKFSVMYRYCKPGGNPGNNVSPNDLKQVRVWTQPQNFRREQWYVFEIEAKFNQTNGYLKIKLDGEQIVNYSGALGYGCATYWESGLYRSARDETIVAKIKNLTIG